jgi:hypothetical protein
MESSKNLSLFGLPTTILCTKLTNQSIKYLSQSCPTLMLEHLSLSHCNEVTDNGIEHLSQGCHRLKTLHLDECHACHTRQSLQQLSEGCLLLEYLSLCFCEKLSIHDLTIIVNCENMVNKLHIAQDNKIVHCNNTDNITHDPDRQPLEITI